jgi:hypothetical protein
MSQWMILKAGVPQVSAGQNVVYDDGNPAKPGEDGFSRDLVNAYCAGLGTTYGANYLGPSLTNLLPPVAGVPQEVTMRQARLALNGMGKLAAVDAAIAAMPEPTRTQAQITWEFSSTVQRTQPLVLSLGPLLGLTSADIDLLFTTAKAL